MKILDEVPADDVRLVVPILCGHALGWFVESWALAELGISNAVFTLRSLKRKIKLRI